MILCVSKYFSGLQKLVSEIAQVYDPRRPTNCRSCEPVVCRQNYIQISVWLPVGLNTGDRYSLSRKQTNDRLRNLIRLRKCISQVSVKGKLMSCFYTIIKPHKSCLNQVAVKACCRLKSPTGADMLSNGHLGSLLHENLINVQWYPYKEIYLKQGSQCDNDYMVYW